MRRLTFGSLAIVVAAVSLLMVTPAFAAKPAAAPNPADRIALATINGQPANGAAPHLGDTVTFSYVLMENVKSPRVQLMCSQNGVTGYAEAYPAAGNSFRLGGTSSTWLANGGPATCVATLYSWIYTPTEVFVSYATVSFSALGKP
jgi:hypothetical protein